jgi:hypothetical protein
VESREQQPMRRQTPDESEFAENHSDHEEPGTASDQPERIFS